MVNFKTFFGEALGLFPKTKPGEDIMAAIKHKPSAAAIERQRQGDIVKSKYGEVAKRRYPQLKYNFQLVDEFKTMMYTCYAALNTKYPYSLLLLGDPGIGKSVVIKETAKELSAVENKKFPSRRPDGQKIEREWVLWDGVSYEKQLDIMENPENYYAFLDIRTAYMTSAGAEGAMVIAQRKNATAAEFYRALPAQFISYITLPTAAGVLFLDEINQASQEVQAILYKIINDRKFNDRPIAPRMLVVAAANLGLTTTAPISTALATRFVGAVLVPDTKAWFKWAEKNDIHPLIVDFVRSGDANDVFFHYPEGEEDSAVQWPNPRAIERFSHQFKIVLDRFRELQQTNPQALENFNFAREAQAEAAGGVGKDWGERFNEYLKQIEEFDVEELAKDEPKFKKLPALDKQKVTTLFFKTLLEGIDASIPENAQPTFEVGSPPLKTFPYDENILNSEIGRFKSIILNNTQDLNKNLLVTIKNRKPEYLLILLDYLVKDDAMFKLLGTLDASLEQI